MSEAVAKSDGRGYRNARSSFSPSVRFDRQLSSLHIPGHKPYRRRYCRGLKL